MGWAEVKKINSDMSEPLNYSNYIYDISMFKENSYVLSKMNQAIWDDFCFNSTYLYGHAGIHDTVLNALSVYNVDRLWEEDFNLGKKLNQFHATDVYAMGNATTVIPSLTMKGYNLLEQKIREGYQRYVEKKLTSTNCGAWLNTTFKFNSAMLSTVTLIDDVINSDSLYAMILTNEAAIVAMTASMTTVAVIASSPNAINLIMNSVTVFIENEVVVNAIIENPSLMEFVLSDATALNVISNNTNTVKAITFSIVAFEKLLSNEVAVEVFTSNEVSNKQLGLSFIDYMNSESVISRYKDNFNNINLLLPNLVGGDAADFNLISLQSSMDAMLAKLNKLITFADIITLNYKAILENPTVLISMFNNQLVVSSIIDNDAVLNLIISTESSANVMASSTIAMNLIADSSKAMLAMCDSSIGRLALYTNYTVTEPILSKSENALAVLTNHVNTAVVTAGGAAYLQSYAGKAFVLSLRLSLTNYPNSLCYHGNYVNGASKLSNTVDQIGTVKFNVNKFASNVMGVAQAQYSGYDLYTTIFKV